MDIKEDPIKWQGIPCSWIRELIIVKVTTFQKLVSRSNAIPIKISAVLFLEINKLTLKFIWKLKGPEIVNMILKNKS